MSFGMLMMMGASGAGGGGGDSLPVSGAVVWFDASDASTITDAGSGAVSQWDDKSGNDYHMSQATSTMRPTTGTVTLNGLNVISFDGGDHLVSVAGGPTLDSDAVTTFFVFQTDTVSPASQGVFGLVRGA